MARVAVVIANFNGAAVLGACLDALERQTWRDFRVVLVDNGATDGSAEAAATRLGARAVLRNARNLGFAAANNAGIARALADPAVDYVLTLNSNTVPAPDFLEQLVAAADAAPPTYGSWQGKVVSTLDARLVDAVGVELSRDSVATQLGHLEIDGARHRSGDIYGVNAAAALYARRFVADVAPDGDFFDADFFAYYEDVDVAVRGVGAGWRAADGAEAGVGDRRSGTRGAAPAV